MRPKSTFLFAVSVNRKDLWWIPWANSVRSTRFRGQEGSKKGKKRPKTAKCLQIPDNKQEAKYLKARTGPAIKFQLAQTKEKFSTEQEYLISIIIENFTPAQEVLLVNSESGTAACLNSRVCGAWVTLLPNIVALSSEHLNVLQFAIKSLGYSILGKVSQALEAYGETLRSLNDVLDIAEEGSLANLLAVMLCLSMTEVHPPLELILRSLTLPSIGLTRH